MCIFAIFDISKEYVSLLLLAQAQETKNLKGAESRFVSPFVREIIFGIKHICVSRCVAQKGILICVFFTVASLHGIDLKRTDPHMIGQKANRKRKKVNQAVRPDVRY